MEQRDGLEEFTESWAEMEARHDVETAAMIRRHAQDRARCLRRDGRDPMKVLSLEQQYLAGLGLRNTSPSS